MSVDVAASGAGKASGCPFALAAALPAGLLLAGLPSLLALVEPAGLCSLSISACPALHVTSWKLFMQPGWAKYMCCPCAVKRHEQGGLLTIG